VFTNRCSLTDVGQTEVAVWPSKPEVLISAIVWEISLALQFRRHTFYQGEFAESVNKLMLHRRQPEIATWLPKPELLQHRNYKTSSVEITTACQVFLTIVSPNKVPSSDCDNVRQMEMKLWKHRRFGPELAISGSRRSLSKSFETFRKHLKAYLYLFETAYE